MTGEKRRNKIIADIKKSEQPVSGSELAKRCAVSRQVVVQDIALLRASGYDILSTTKGYVVNQSPTFNRIIHVRHKDDQIQEELNAIVDLGGRVLDVFVEHPVYGRLKAELDIHSRRDVDNFMEQLTLGHATPLNRLTSGEHWHTIESDSKDIFDLIENKLRKLGLLCE